MTERRDRKRDLTVFPRKCIRKTYDIKNYQKIYILAHKYQCKNIRYIPILDLTKYGKKYIIEYIYYSNRVITSTFNYLPYHYEKKAFIRHRSTWTLILMLRYYPNLLRISRFRFGKQYKLQRCGISQWSDRMRKYRKDINE